MENFTVTRAYNSWDGFGMNNLLLRLLHRPSLNQACRLTSGMAPN